MFLQVQLGSPLFSGYSSHYALVKKKQLTRNICKTDRDFEMVQKYKNEYQIKIKLTC